MSLPIDKVWENFLTCSCLSVVASAVCESLDVGALGTKCSLFLRMLLRGVFAKYDLGQSLFFTTIPGRS